MQLPGITKSAVPPGAGIAKSAAPPGLWPVFRARMLELHTMPRRLRLLMLLTLAQMAIAAVLLALRGAGLATTPLLVSRIGATSVPVVVLWFTVAFSAAAWGYLLAGALLGHPLVGVLATLAFALSLVPLSQDVGWHGAPAVLRGLTLAAMAAVAVSFWLARRSRVPDSRTVPGWRTALLVCLVAAVYGTFAWDASSRGSFALFSFGEADQLMSVSFFLLPPLLLAGEQFAEWAELIGDRVAYAADRLGSTRTLAAVAALISLAVLVHVAVVAGSQIPAQLVLFAVAVAVVCKLARDARPAAGWPRELPWAAIALTACAFVAVLLVEVYRTTPGSVQSVRSRVHAHLQSYLHAEDPQFDLEVPTSWSVRTIEPGRRGAGRALISFAGGGSSFSVASESAHSVEGGQQLLAGVLAREYPGARPGIGPGLDDEGWRRTPVALPHGLAGVAWDRQLGALEWVLLGVSPASRAAATEPQFREIWQSFAVNSHPVSPLAAVHQLAHRRLDPYRYDPVLVVPFVVWAIAAVAVALVLRLVSPRLSPAVVLGAVFVLAFGALYVLSDLRQVAEELFDGRVGPLYSLRLPGIQAAVALGTICWIALRAVRGGLRRTTTWNLLMLGAGLQLLAWIAELYKAGSLVGARLSIAQAAVILLALGWELVVSGEALTNAHSSAFPRATRVLMLCGYLMLVMTTVMLFSSLRAVGSGAGLEPQFESEGWPALGILQLGVTSLLCLAALRLGAFTGSRRSPARGLRPASAQAPPPGPPAPATAPTGPPPAGPRDESGSAR